MQKVDHHDSRHSSVGQWSAIRENFPVGRQRRHHLVPRVPPHHHVKVSEDIYQPSHQVPSLCEHTAGMAAPHQHSSHTQADTRIFQRMENPYHHVTVHIKHTHKFYLHVVDIDESTMTVSLIVQHQQCSGIIQCTLYIKKYASRCLANVDRFFKILIPTDSCTNSLGLCIHHTDFHLTCNILPHYLVKFKNLFFETHWIYYQRITQIYLQSCIHWFTQTEIIIGLHHMCRDVYTNIPVMENAAERFFVFRSNLHYCSWFKNRVYRVPSITRLHLNISDDWFYIY